MPEIKTEPVRIRMGQTIAKSPTGVVQINSEDCYMFDADHTIADIIRFAIDQSDLEEVDCIVQLMKEEQDLTGV